MKNDWQYLCTDYENDGENKLKVIYYERIKNIYGMIATVEVGRSTQIDDDEKSSITVVREYTKNLGGSIPWREFTMADYIKYQGGEFDDEWSSISNPKHDRKNINNKNGRHRNDY